MFIEFKKKLKWPIEDGGHLRRDSYQTRVTGIIMVANNVFVTIYKLKIAKPIW